MSVARPELAKLLFEIQNEGDANRPWTLDHFISELAQSEASLFLWPDLKNPQGFVCYRRVVDEVWIFNIAVRQKGRGHGAALLEGFERHIRENEEGAISIGLEVASRNAAACRLYRGRGFQQIGLRKAYYSDGDDALLLAKCLSPQPPSQGKN